MLITPIDATPDVDDVAEMMSPRYASSARPWRGAYGCRLCHTSLIIDYGAARFASLPLSCLLIIADTLRCCRRGNEPRLFIVIASHGRHRRLMRVTLLLLFS